jgi:tight adherence protein B
VPSTSQRSICAEPQIAQLTAAIWRLAERTGAPAADLVERIEADARGADRAKASAAAQAAGAQGHRLAAGRFAASGIALGYGSAPIRSRCCCTLPLGAACAASAVVLQSAGLLWADRLANGPTR